MTAEGLLDSCRWAEPGGRDAALVALRFLDSIGIPVASGSAEGGFLPGLIFRDGVIVIDPDADVYPGDLLHEAGHFAVTDPATRPAMSDPGDDPAQEMASLAWSAAAGIACGMPLEVVFHEHGYKGGGAGLAAQFAQGSGPGVPMLAWYGMTAEPHGATPDQPGFPVMQRWLR